MQDQIAALRQILDAAEEVERIKRTTKLEIGSKFEFEGVEYTLCKVPNDGAYQWKRPSGHYALTQGFYVFDTPTLEHVLSMNKYLPR